MAGLEVVYTYHVLEKLQERGLRLGWVDLTLSDPETIEPDAHDPLVAHALRIVPEFGDRVLRVVFTDEGDQRRVITAFFDRRRKPRPKV